LFFHVVFPLRCPRPPSSTLFPYTTLFRSFVVSLSLIATRAETLTVAGQLSAMTQGVGYTITAALLFSSGIAYGKNPIGVLAIIGDRKSTRLNSSHVSISYAVFCLKKKSSN